MPRTKIFISYSHADRKWLERLRVHLGPLAEQDALDLWDDSRIGAGTKWADEIGRALAEAHVAILLVSPDFLNSAFITRKEIPPLLQAAEARGVKLLCLFVEPSIVEHREYAYADAATGAARTFRLTDFQGLNSPRHPIASLKRRSERQSALVDAAKKILKLATEPPPTLQVHEPPAAPVTRVDAAATPPRSPVVAPRATETARAQSVEVKVPADPVRPQSHARPATPVAPHATSAEKRTDAQPVIAVAALKNRHSLRGRIILAGTLLGAIVVAWVGSRLLPTKEPASPPASGPAESSPAIAASPSTGVSAARDIPGLRHVGRNEQGYHVYLRETDHARMVLIAGETFRMGSDLGSSNEEPVHAVTLSPFLMDETEVTWAQYRRFVEATGARMPERPSWGPTDDHPAVNVMWDEARAYGEWAGGGLPTEAQWEFAARGSDGRTYPWGSDWDATKANGRGADDDGFEFTAPVGSFRAGASPHGLLDMAGNVSEWVGDWYDSSYDANAATDPTGPGYGWSRVLRGGSFRSHPEYLRSAHRDDIGPDVGRGHVGFRVAWAAAAGP